MKVVFKTFLEQPTVLRVLMSPGSLFHNVGAIREKKRYVTKFSLDFYFFKQMVFMYRLIAS